MKKVINYEKDILFKTNIGEICSISLEHDFTVDDGFLKGDFILSGEYKPNELSVNKEPFNFRLPLEYELENNVDLSTLSYDIDNFEYNVKQDELSVYIDFGIRYEEKKVEPKIPEIKEDEINNDYGFESYDLTPKESDRLSEKEETLKEVKQEEEKVEKAEEIQSRLSEENKSLILDSSLDTDEYVTYHVHIVREGDSLESIATKYNVTIDTIKEYNSFETLELHSKLIIPEVTNE